MHQTASTMLILGALSLLLILRGKPIKNKYENPGHKIQLVSNYQQMDLGIKHSAIKQRLSISSHYYLLKCVINSRLCLALKYDILI